MSIKLEIQETCRYKTSKGSLYVQYNNCTTKRNKSLHLEHDPSDLGWKEESDFTIYVNESAAKVISLHIYSKGGRNLVIFNDHKLHLVTLNKEGDEIRSVCSPIDYVRLPQIELHPYEVNGLTEHSLGHIVTGKSHLGNKIVQFVN